MPGFEFKPEINTENNEAENSVLYVHQNLTQNQQNQVHKNIGLFSLELEEIPNWKEQLINKLNF